jgi:hypothetical protein
LNEPLDSLTLEIYKQACEDHRFFGDMRFKQFTVFGVLNGLLLNVKVKESAIPVSFSMICIIAMAVTAAIWVMEVRASIYGSAKRTIAGSIAMKSRNAKNLLANPELKQHFAWLSATLVTVMVYTFSFWLWFYAWYHDEQHLHLFYWEIGLLFLGGAFLMIYTARQYARLWKTSLRF